MNLDDYSLFRTHKSTLHQLSYDSANDEYMTASEINAVDFDLVKQKYCNQFHMSEERAGSADALLQTPQGIFFIEFKNGDARKEKQGIREKKDESLMIYCDITGLEISETRKSTDFILVYNEKNTKISSNEKMAIAMARKSHLSYAIMDLDKHRGLCYRNIQSMNQKEFENWIGRQEN